MELKYIHVYMNDRYILVYIYLISNKSKHSTNIKYNPIVTYISIAYILIQS